MDAIYVFPGSGRKGHLVEPRKAWKRILKNADIIDFRIHDLRRTLGSWQAMQGSSMPIIGKSLGHKSIQSTAIYSRSSLDSVREFVSQATQAMIDVAEKKETSKVKEETKLLH